VIHRIDAFRPTSTQSSSQKGARKQILLSSSPGSIVSVNDEDDYDLVSDDDEPSPSTGGKGGGRKKRRSLKTNSLRKKFPSTYRNAANVNELFGRQVSLGKAVMVLMPAMFGVNYPSEKVQHPLRERLFKAAAYYSLSDDEIAAVFAAESADREDFLLGLVTAALPKLRYDLGNIARAHFQEAVFCSIARDPIIQAELGFDPFQSMVDM
jgi:hypothetical protein